MLSFNQAGFQKPLRAEYFPRTTRSNSIAIIHIPNPKTGQSEAVTYYGESAAAPDDKKDHQKKFQHGKNNDGVKQYHLDPSTQAGRSFAPTQYIGKKFKDYWTDEQVRYEAMHNSKMTADNVDQNIQQRIMFMIPKKGDPLAEIKFSCRKDFFNMGIKVCEAVIELHQSKRIHRDLHRRNILGEHKNGEVSKINLVDFGRALFLGQPIYQTRLHPSVTHEEYKFTHADTPIDFFQLGVLFEELSLSQNNTFQFSLTQRARLITLYNRMQSTDASARPSANDAKAEFQLLAAMDYWLDEKEDKTSDPVFRKDFSKLSAALSWSDILRFEFEINPAKHPSYFECIGISQVAGCYQAYLQENKIVGAPESIVDFQTMMSSLKNYPGILLDQVLITIIGLDKVKSFIKTKDDIIEFETLLLNQPWHLPLIVKSKLTFFKGIEKLITTFVDNRPGYSNVVLNARNTRWTLVENRNDINVNVGLVKDELNELLLSCKKELKSEEEKTQSPENQYARNLKLIGQQLEMMLTHKNLPFELFPSTEKRLRKLAKDMQSADGSNHQIMVNFKIESINICIAAFFLMNQTSFARPIFKKQEQAWFDLLHTAFPTLTDLLEADIDFYPEMRAILIAELGAIALKKLWDNHQFIGRQTDAGKADLIRYLNAENPQAIIDNIQVLENILAFYPAHLHQQFLMKLNPDFIRLLLMDRPGYISAIEALKPENLQLKKDPLDLVTDMQTFCQMVDRYPRHRQVQLMELRSEAHIKSLIKESNDLEKLIAILSYDPLRFPFNVNCFSVLLCGLAAFVDAFLKLDKKHDSEKCSSGRSVQWKTGPDVNQLSVAIIQHPLDKMVTSIAADFKRNLTPKPIDSHGLDVINKQMLLCLSNDKHHNVHFYPSIKPFYTELFNNTSKTLKDIYDYLHTLGFLALFIDNQDKLSDEKIYNDDQCKNTLGIAIANFETFLTVLLDFSPKNRIHFAKRLPPNHLQSLMQAAPFNNDFKPDDFQKYLTQDLRDFVPTFEKLDLLVRFYPYRLRARLLEQFDFDHLKNLIKNENQILRINSLLFKPENNMALVVENSLIYILQGFEVFISKFLLCSDFLPRPQAGSTRPFTARNFIWKHNVNVKPVVTYESYKIDSLLDAIEIKLTNHNMQESDEKKPIAADICRAGAIFSILWKEAKENDIYPSINRNLQKIIGKEGMQHPDEKHRLTALQACQQIVTLIFISNFLIWQIDNSDLNYTDQWTELLPGLHMNLDLILDAELDFKVEYRLGFIKRLDDTKLRTAIREAKLPNSENDLIAYLHAADPTQAINSIDKLVNVLAFYPPVLFVRFIDRLGIEHVKSLLKTPEDQAKLKTLLLNNAQAVAKFSNLFDPVGAATQGAHLLFPKAPSQQPIGSVISLSDAPKHEKR